MPGKARKYEGRRRLSIDVPDDLYDRVSRLFEWGERSRMFIALLTYACDMIEKHGDKGLLVFLRTHDYNSLSPLLNREEKSNGDN